MWGRYLILFSSWSSRFSTVCKHNCVTTIRAKPMHVVTTKEPAVVLLIPNLTPSASPCRWCREQTRKLGYSSSWVQASVWEYLESISMLAGVRPGCSEESTWGSSSMWPAYRPRSLLQHGRAAGCSWPPASIWPSPGCCSHLWSESLGGSLSLWLCLSN